MQYQLFWDQSDILPMIDIDMRNVLSLELEVLILSILVRVLTANLLVVIADIM